MSAIADTSAILVCAGNATRMQGKNKILLPLGDTTVIGMAMRAFEQCERVAELIVVARPADHDAIRETAEKAGITKLHAVVEGGSTRQESVMCGLHALSKTTTMLAIHDGARPLVLPAQIAQVIQDASIFGGATLGVPVKDTIKVVNDNLIVDTPYRPHLYITQTPQVFKRQLYFEAVTFAREHGLDFTDDCQLVEAINHKIYMPTGDYTNLKITTPEDIAIGHGYDVHRLVEGRKLILGGVEVPYEKGLLGHSDADVLAHAVMDSMLGALSLGDIGCLFPDTDPKYAGADSMLLMKEVVERVKEMGYVVGNLDATILCQRPRLMGYLTKMQLNIAEVCGVRYFQVSVKATTEEKLGFTGDGSGIAVHCVCLLVRE